MVLVFSISNFFINEISQANKLSAGKKPTCANLALVTNQFSFSSGFNKIWGKSDKKEYRTCNQKVGYISIQFSYLSSSTTFFMR